MEEKLNYSLSAISGGDSEESDGNLKFNWKIWKLKTIFKKEYTKEIF